MRLLIVLLPVLLLSACFNFGGVLSVLRTLVFSAKN